MKINKLQKNKGFTLVEILVATTIFMLVMLVGMGALLISSNSAKKAKALNAAMDNVNFALENMSRSLRLGSNYYCTGIGGAPLSGISTNDCPGGQNAIAFTPAYHDFSDTAFQLSPEVNGKRSIQKVVPLSITNLTAPEVNITDLKFVVRGSSLIDGIQPSVYITVKGVVTIRGEETNFAMQTLVSQRNVE